MSSVNNLQLKSARGASTGVLANGVPDLASLFECPICYNYAFPPIFQCESGHLVCSVCKPKLNNCCAQCRMPIGNIRNLLMEKLADTVHFPCRYAQNGCGALLLHSEKIGHEDFCDRRTYCCPFPEKHCEWEGPLEQVMPHILASHKSKPNLEGEDIFFLASNINLPGNVDWVMMQSCFDHHFILVLVKQENNGKEKFFFIVQLIGSRKQTLQFTYRLELSWNRIKLICEATPISIHDGVSSAILNSDCLIFDKNTTKQFSENDDLTINVQIFRACEK